MSFLSGGIKKTHPKKKAFDIRQLNSSGEKTVAVTLTCHWGADFSNDLLLTWPNSATTDRKDSQGLRLKKKPGTVVSFCLQIRQVIDEAVLLWRASESLITNSL